MLYYAVSTQVVSIICHIGCPPARTLKINNYWRLAWAYKQRKTVGSSATIVCAFCMKFIFSWVLLVREDVQWTRDGIVSLIYSQRYRSFLTPPPAPGYSSVRRSSGGTRLVCRVVRHRSIPVKYAGTIARWCRFIPINQPNYSCLIIQTSCVNKQ